MTGEFPAQKASDAENDSIWWRHHEITQLHIKIKFWTFVQNTWVSQPFYKCRHHTDNGINELHYVVKYVTNETLIDQTEKVSR